MLNAISRFSPGLAMVAVALTLSACGYNKIPTEQGPQGCSLLISGNCSSSTRAMRACLKRCARQKAKKVRGPLR
jgi:hypothetical protein